MLRQTLVFTLGMIVGFILASSILPRNQRSPLIQFNARGSARIIINRPSD